MKLKTAVLGVVTVCMTAFAGANARAASYTYDFIDYIDSQGGAKNGTGGEKAIISAFSLLDISNTKSLTINAHGTNFNSVEGSFTSFPYAYFDYGKAGIGVCQVLDGTQCDVPSDDNVTGPGGTNAPTEILSLSFGEDLRVSKLLFRNDGHTPIFGSGKSIKIAVSNGMGTISDSVFTSYALEVLTSSSLLGAGLLDLTPFNLSSGDYVHIMYDDQQFYMSGIEISAVPLPPSAILFGTALFGLGALGRHRKKADRNRLNIAKS